MNQAKRAMKNKFGRGILWLFIFIFGGVCVAEMQLNDLTQESVFMTAFNIRRDPQLNGFAVYFLGERMEIGPWEDTLITAEADGVRLHLTDQRSIRIPFKTWYMTWQGDFYRWQRQAQRYVSEFF